MKVSIEENEDGSVILFIGTNKDASAIVLSRQDLYQVYLFLRDYFNTEEG